jgi:glucose dehydrogenase
MKSLLSILPCLLALNLAAGKEPAPAPAPAAEKPAPPELFARDNLVAWCIVPFDARRRGPEMRAEMLRRLGFTRFAYDWREEHIPQFEEELQTLARWGVRLQAFWGVHDEALRLFEKYKLHPQLWIMMNGTGETQEARVKSAAEGLLPILAKAKAIGSQVGIYNHGGWGGEPENMVAVCDYLKKNHGADNIGIVYNLHHGHSHLDRFPALLQKMLPYLCCLNLNGMNRDGDQRGQKIFPLGNGEFDLQLLQTIRDSGYAGPIGIIGHTQDDAEKTLADNLDGLDWLVTQLDGRPAPGPRPPRRVGAAEGALGVDSLTPAFGRALWGNLLAEGNEGWRMPPLTVSLRARLFSSNGFNILVASDTKASDAHWEIFTQAGSGKLLVYTPGLVPDHLSSDRVITDGAWHHIVLQYAEDRLTLWLDGEQIADQPYTRRSSNIVAGGLGIGRLVEGEGPLLDGHIDDLWIARGLHPVHTQTTPHVQTPETLGLWSFDDLNAQAPTWAEEVEDPARRAELPEFQVLPAAPVESLAAARPLPENFYGTWTRSHGDDHNSRFAPHSRITPGNVHRLRQAWVYHSGDKLGDVQCNPILVGDTLYGPTSGQHLVALDARTGAEKWRFNPAGRPAFRGLVYWPGDSTAAPRLLFTADNYLWALDPATGKPIASFGEGGKTFSGESRVAGVIFEDLIVLPSMSGPIHAYDLRTGARRWTFNTIPGHDQPNQDTWNGSRRIGANCWGGQALDQARGIVYIGTGSPKPNFTGNTHTGKNLYANCVIALDARSGALRWHFQEIPHDIWNLDIPAPPNLVTVRRGDKLVDAVAQVTKFGNTLLLDRETGQPLFPVRLRRAPVSTLPGERTWPYQPDLELPEPFARQTFTAADITTRTPEAREYVLQRIGNANFGWMQPFAENVPTVLYGIHGGAEWTGAAYDPRSRRLFVSSNEVPWIITVSRADAAENKSLPGERDAHLRPMPVGPRGYVYDGYPKLVDHEGIPGSQPPYGTLNCIDLDSGKIVWKVPLGTYPQLAAKGITGTGAENFGGASLTAGGVLFCAGSPDEKIYAFDAADGKELWSAQLPFGGYAPPMFYELDGMSYVLIPATGGGKLGTRLGDAYVAFVLDDAE